MDRDVKSKKYVYRVIAVGMTLFAAGFVFLACGALLQDSGYGNFKWEYAGVISFAAFVVCDVIALFLLIHIYPDALFYDCEKRDKKYTDSAVSSMKHMNAHGLNEMFRLNKFKEAANGLLRRKKFTFLKDNICFYVKFVDIQDVEAAVDTEFRIMDQLEEKTKSVCLILFLFKQHVDESDIGNVKEISKNIILNEMLIPVSCCRTGVIVLVDEMTDTGYFLDIKSKISILIYAYGCRLLKKYLKGQES